MLNDRTQNFPGKYAVLGHKFIRSSVPLVGHMHYGTFVIAPQGGIFHLQAALLTYALVQANGCCLVFLSTCAVTLPGCT